MTGIIIEETKWEELEELRKYEPNSYSMEQAYESYEEWKENDQY